MTKDRRQASRNERHPLLVYASVLLCLALSACAQLTGGSASGPAPATTPSSQATATSASTSISGQTAEPAAKVTVSVVSPTAPPATATAVPTAILAPTPAPPKPVTVAIVGEPESLHPLYARSLAAQTVLGALFVGCVGQDEKGAPVALGCESAPTQENGGARFVGEGDDRHLEATFHIRKGWRWTDGTPVTAQDAIYTWQLIMAPAAQIDDALSQKVFAMTAPDTATIVVSFMSAGQAKLAAGGKLRGDVPFEYFSQRGSYDMYAKQAAPLADANYWGVVRWLPMHLLKDITPEQQLTGTFASQPVGDGAFELSAWNKGSELTLQRSKQPFPLQTQGNVPAIIFKFAKDEAGAAQLVQGGGAQLSQPLPSGLVNSATISVTPMAAPLVEQVVLNTSNFPFDDVKVRQAASLAISAGAIISDPATGPATAAQVTDPGSMFRGLGNGGLVSNYDLARAQALLKEAGWSCDTSPCVKAMTGKNGAAITQTLTFTLVTNEREPRNAISQLIQQQLAQAGFGVDIQIVRGLGKASKLFAPYEQDGILLTRKFDAALYQAPSLTRFSGVFDCASIPSEKAHAVTHGNVFGYCDPAADAQMVTAESGEATISEAGRTKAMLETVKLIADNALFIPLYSPLWAMPSRDLQGVRFTGSGVMTWNVWEWQTN